MKIFIILITFIWPWVVLQSQPLPLLSTEYNTFFSEIDHNLWIASALQGYNRYRGVDVKYYRLNDSLSGLEGSVIQSGLYQDHIGRLWTSTYEKLCYYSPDTDRFTCFSIQIDGKEATEEYHVFHIDRLNKFLYLRAGGHLILFDVNKLKIHAELGNTKSNWFTVNQDTLLGFPLLNGPGLEIWTKNTQKWNKKYDVLHSCGYKEGINVIKGFLWNGNVWLVTVNHGLIRYDNVANCKTFLYKGNEVLYKNVSKYKNKLLLTTEKQGILVFDLQHEKFELHPTIENVKIYDVFIPKLEKVLSSVNGHGVESHPILALYGDQNTLNGEDQWNQVLHMYNITLLVDKNNRLTIVQNGHSKNIWLANSKLPIQKINHVAILNTNELLICDYNACFTYNITKQIFTKLTSLNGELVISLKTYNDTLYYISDEKLNINSILQKFSKPKHIKHPLVKAFQTVQYLSDEVKTYTTYSSNLLIDALQRDTLINLNSYINEAIYDHKFKTHYVGTNDGLFSIDSNYNVAKHIYSHTFNEDKQIYHIEQDESHVYFTEGKRIARLNKVDGKISYFYKNSYDKNPTFAIDTAHIFIALKYLERYPLATAFEKMVENRLILDVCTILDKDFTSAFINQTSLQLDHDKNQISWKFYINHWEHSHLAKVQYRIPGLDDGWTMIENGQEFTTTMPRAGNYALEVQGLLPDGSLTDIQKYLFRIHPPWYDTLGFKLLVLCLIAAIAYTMYRYRLAQMAEKYRIKSELNTLERSALQAQMNPHFIFNCLNSIQNFIMRNDKDMAMDYLGRFARLIRQYLNASAHDMVTLEEEIAMLENYLHLEQMRFNHTFDYHFVLPPNLDQTAIMLPPLLIQPFVENAVLHGMADKTEGGLISISFSHTPKTLHITIKDNGKGIQKKTPNPNRRSLGVSITEKRLKYINDHAEGNYAISTMTGDWGTEIGIDVHL